jgi:hypothetical protein
MISHVSTMGGDEDERKLSAHKPKPFEADRDENEVDNEFF